MSTAGYLPFPSSLQAQPSLLCSGRPKQELHKGYHHLLPCQLASWKLLQHQALEREWKVRERRDFQVPVSVSITPASAPDSLCTPHPSHPVPPGMCFPLSHTHVAIKMPTSLVLHQPDCTSPQVQPTLPGLFPELRGSPYSTSSLLLFAVSTCGGLQHFVLPLDSQHVYKTNPLYKISV